MRVDKCFIFFNGIWEKSSEIRASIIKVIGRVQCTDASTALTFALLAVENLLIHIYFLSHNINYWLNSRVE